MLKGECLQSDKYIQTYENSCGWIGLYELLKEYGIQVEAFIVTEHQVNHREYEGIPIISIDTMEIGSGAMILIGATKRYACDMYMNAKRLGYEKVLDLSGYAE